MFLEIRAGICRIYFEIAEKTPLAPSGWIEYSSWVALSPMVSPFHDSWMKIIAGLLAPHYSFSASALGLLRLLMFQENMLAMAC